MQYWKFLRWLATIVLLCVRAGHPSPTEPVLPRRIRQHRRPGVRALAVDCGSRVAEATVCRSGGITSRALPDRDRCGRGRTTRAHLRAS